MAQQTETNPPRNHEVAGPIFGLTQWVKELVLLWLWRRPAAVAPIGPLAWEPPYATNVALKSGKNKTKQNNTWQCKFIRENPGREDLTFFSEFFDTPFGIIRDSFKKNIFSLADCFPDRIYASSYSRKQHKGVFVTEEVST